MLKKNSCLQEGSHVWDNWSTWEGWQPQNLGYPALKRGILYQDEGSLLPGRALHSVPSLSLIKERSENWCSRKHLDYYLVQLEFCLLLLLILLLFVVVVVVVVVVLRQGLPVWSRLAQNSESSVFGLSSVGILCACWYIWIIVVVAVIGHPDSKV